MLLCKGWLDADGPNDDVGDFGDAIPEDPLDDLANSSSLAGSVSCSAKATGGSG